MNFIYHSKNLQAHIPKKIEYLGKLDPKFYGHEGPRKVLVILKA
jgi:hypothetical protein